MGQCMSRKAVASLTTSAAAGIVVVNHHHHQHHRLHHLQKQQHDNRRPHHHRRRRHCPPDSQYLNNNFCNMPSIMSPEDEIKPAMKKSMTKGVATSFGFRKKTSPTSPQAPPTATLTTNNPIAARRLANATESLDSNGNDAPSPAIASHDTASLTANALPSGRSMPHRLPPPKKEAHATGKVSRFGFRQPNANRLNRVADMNTHPPTRIEYNNANANNNAATLEREREREREHERLASEIKAKVEMQQRLLDAEGNTRPPGGKFTLHTNQLPRPQAVRLLESKTAKTLANNNRKHMAAAVVATAASGDESTEDSGVGSNCGDIQQLDKSPMSRRLRNNKLAKPPRTLDVLLTGAHKFDVRDAESPPARLVRKELPALPALPSLNAFHRPSPNSGFVRDRALEYQRHINDVKGSKERIRKISLTSSASECGEDDKQAPYRKNEKIAKFIKAKPIQVSPPSSIDDQMWSSHAGEAMADEFSSVCTSSSGDEAHNQARQHPLIMEASIESLITAKAANRLSLVDPQFAAIAAATVSATLIEDEPSPVDSIACSPSYSSSPTVEAKEEEKNNDQAKSPASSSSKEINEKNSTSTPGSPTNASNSLSLSDGRDDFLIDDEIADQPALLFDDTLTNSNQPSEATSTVIVESTPKTARRSAGVLHGALENSPLLARNRKFGRQRASSLDTLSPCESIASDDCMMDYDLSSGVEDGNDRTEINSHYNLDLDGTLERTVEVKVTNMRDWSTLLAGCDMGRDSPKRLSFRSSRLLRSRGGTPTSSVPDSPRSDHGVVAKKTTAASSVSPSPLRLSGSRSSTGTGYDSDDSGIIRLDRSQHCLMQQDVMAIKTMLLKLKRVLHEPANEDYMLMSETHNSLNDNGFFSTGYGSDGGDKDGDKDEREIMRAEMDNLRRQVVFLQGQLEDSERAAQGLREEMVTLTMKFQSSQSAPASVSPMVTSTSSMSSTINAATQTERIRPISAGPTLLQDAAAQDLSPGSLVSVSEPTQTAPPATSSSSSGRRSRPAPTTPTKSASASSLPSPSRLWRMPGEPPSPSAIPRRSCSRSRLAANTSLTATATTTTT